MQLGLSLSLRHEVKLTQHIGFPKPNWSAVSAVHSGALCRSEGLRRQLPLEGLALRERLAAVEQANAVFRYDYRVETDEDTGKSRFFRIPLLRNRNVSIADIREPISRVDFLAARNALEKVGALERIVRAVPYGDIYDRVVAYLHQEGESLENIVLVGVDRGGRIPTLLARVGLGQSTAYFLKVDQYSGQGPNVARLLALGAQGVFRDRFVLFIDSTVDSGRQILHLQKWFNESRYQREWGYRGWVVAGSNDEGKTLPHHLNINWGVDPDTTFEDDPLLMGVDYEGGIGTVIRAAPSHTASTIRSAFLRVPAGEFFDFSDTAQLEALRRADREIGRRIRQAQKMSAEIYIDSWQDQERLNDETLPTTDGTHTNEKINPSLRLAVIGGKSSSLQHSQAEYLAGQLSPRYILLTGSQHGIPGSVYHAFEYVDGAVAIDFSQQAADAEGGAIGGWIIPTEYRLGTEDSATIRHVAMISAAHMVFALPGSSGTLNELLIASALGKPIVALRSQVTQALQKTAWARRNPRLQIVETVQEGVAKLRDFRVHTN